MSGQLAVGGEATKPSLQLLQLSADKQLLQFSPQGEQIPFAFLNVPEAQSALPHTGVLALGI